MVWAMFELASNDFSIAVTLTVGLPQDPDPLRVTIYGGPADGRFVEPKTEHDLEPCPGQNPATDH
jgi:hypothetical protein